MKLNINGKVLDVQCTEDEMLSTVLRREGFTGVKVGCGAGQCGACNVILDGQVVRSCVKKMKLVPEGAEIITVEGIGTPENPHPLQQAFVTYGAIQCGFCTPGFIVSAYALLQENPNPTRQEVRDCFSKNRNACRCTGYKQIVDSVMKAAAVMRGELTMDDITYHEPEDGELYGTPLPRYTSIYKATGTLDYGDDYTLKNMPENTAHIAVVLPDADYAKILSIDTEEALAMPGVEKVITHEDIQGDNSIFFPNMHARATCVGFEHLILPPEMIYHRGDVVALVAADTRDHARAAAKKVKVNLEPLKPCKTILESLADDAPQINEEFPNMYLDQPVIKGEDTRKVLAESAYVVEGSFHSQRQPHLVIEPDVCQAYMDEESGRLAIRCKSQMLHNTAGLIGTGIGWDAVDMRIIQNPVGASFGYSISPLTPALAGAATLAMGKPIAMTLSYEEHQMITGKRAPSYSNIRMGCDEEGKITGLEFQIAYDKGAYSETAYILIPKGVRFMASPYTIPNAMGLSMGVISNNAYSTAYKGFGSVQCYTGSEQIMDMLAEKAGIDRWEIRYKNVYREGDTNLNQAEFDVYPMPALLEKIKPYYDEAVARAKAEDTPEKRRGVGITCAHFNVVSDYADRCEVALELNEDDTFTGFDTWHSLGQGADAGSLMHVYDALRPMNIPTSRIKLCKNDTWLCPDTGPAAGSRSHYCAGNAYRDAAKQLMDAMRKEDGTYRTYAEMVAEGIPTKYLGVNDTTDTTTDLDPVTGEGRPSPEYTYGVILCEVEVDTATGKVKVLSMRCVADIGTVANPVNAAGQGYGAFEHGIGMALTEDYDDYKKHRNMVGAGFPYIDMVPDDMEIEFIETPRPTGPHGSSGCAEMFQTSPHACVINAIYDACGVRVHELPATPDKILAGLEAIKNGEKPYEPEPYYFGHDFYEYMDGIVSGEN